MIVSSRYMLNVCNSGPGQLLILFDKQITCCGYSLLKIFLVRVQFSGDVKITAVLARLDHHGGVPSGKEA